MSDKIEQLQKLHDLLKASKHGEQVLNIYDGQKGRLTVWEDIRGDDEVLIHIEVDPQNPERFTYQALTNKFFSNPEKYLTVEKEANRTAEEVIKAAHRLIENSNDLQVPNPLIV